MNLHGYKLKYKNLVWLIKKEQGKKQPNTDKLKRLERSKRFCSRKIKELQKNNRKATKLRKRRFRKERKGKK